MSDARRALRILYGMSHYGSASKKNADEARATLAAALDRADRLEAALREFVECGAELDDVRLRYMTMQVPRETLDAARSALKGEKG